MQETIPVTVLVHPGTSCTAHHPPSADFPGLVKPADGLHAGCRFLITLATGLCVHQASISMFRAVGAIGRQPVISSALGFLLMTGVILFNGFVIAPGEGPPTSPACPRCVHLSRWEVPGTEPCRVLCSLNPFMSE